ncbi:hypothetical protein [Pedobacter alpinus]|uniref:RiboL-PSP-HEPN domain-containing protein n=1 Tax=Pedobacter alpinus TaxID=1590643 RepID=A0ABW5TVJ5_9SPHI
MKHSFQKRFTSAIDENFETVQPFYDSRLIVMVELTNLRNEILNCLLLGLYQTSIFSTNHFLERLIKVSLIKNHTQGFNYSNAVAYNEKIEESKILFDSLVLAESLKKAKQEGLITESEMTELTSLRRKIRNPYTHAEISKINEGSPKSFKGFMFSFEDVKHKLINKEKLELPEITEINTFSPTFAQLQQEDNSKIIAFNYFKKIYDLMLKMENRLSAKK